MHARHRSPGNGYRSGSMGMGLSVPRISPEASARGHGLYNLEYRGFNRGFGRSQGGYHKTYQPPPSPPLPRRSTDIFMEAGRLAAEYLVSQGLLPPSVLSIKWQSGSLKKQASDFHDFRSQEFRASASASDAVAGLGRRRYSDDYSQSGYRSQFKGRRKGGSFRSGLDFDREYGRSSSWSDRGRVSLDIEVGEDTFSRQHEENPAAEDQSNELNKSVSGEFAIKRDKAGDSELNKHSPQDEAHSKTGSSNAGKELLNDGEVSKMSEHSSSLSAGTGEVKYVESHGDETENRTTLKGSLDQQFGPADDPSGKNDIDLLTLCKFAKVPTKTRSSLSMRCVKTDSCPDIEQSTPNSGVSTGAELPSDKDCPDRSSNGMLASRPHDIKLPDSRNSETPSIHPVEYMENLGIADDVEKGKCQRSQSLPHSILLGDNDRGSGQRLSDFQRSYSVDQERGEKRAAEDGDSKDDTKRQREWLPSLVSKVDDCLYLPDASEKQTSPQESKPSLSEMLVVGDRGNLADNPRSPKRDGKSSVMYAEERQLFPSSFKICDLNLAGVSDAHDNNVGDPMLIFPAISETKKETNPIAFDLSMGRSSEYATQTINGKEIEIIDLENYSAEEVKANDNLEKKQEARFMSYAHQSRMPGAIPDVPDYNDGLMVEFLGSFENIPPIAQGINPATEDISNLQQNNALQNEIGFQNGQGTLGDDQGTQTDDDSIFMSLGEIPLTFLHAWDQPPARGFEKPF